MTVGNLAGQTAEHCDALLDTNIRGVFYGLKHELRQMLRNPGGPSGAIVNPAPVTSSLTGVPVFLCADEARLITGYTLAVDGGFLAQ